MLGEFVSYFGWFTVGNITRVSFKYYAYALAITVVLCLFLISLVDDPVARLFVERYRSFHGSKLAVDGVVFVVPISGAVFFLCGYAAFGRRLSRFGEAAMLAGLSAILAFAICDFLLKPVFGRQTVYYYLPDPRLHGFRFMQGGYRSSFPSGHTAIVVSMLTVFWRYYPRWVLLYSALFLVAAIVLVVGEWHFVSDIVAGAFLGAASALAIADRFQTRLRSEWPGAENAADRPS